MSLFRRGIRQRAKRGGVLKFGSGAIPLHGWGLLVWGTIAVALAVMLYIVFKKGDVLQEKILKLTTRKKK